MRSVIVDGFKFINGIHEVSPYHWVHRQERLDGNHIYSARMRCLDGGVTIVSEHNTPFAASSAIFDLLADALPAHQ